MRRHPRSTARLALALQMALAAAAPARAGVVSHSEALRAASSFFHSDSTHTLSAAAAPGLEEVWNSRRLRQGDGGAASDTVPTIYVFAPETKTGFVVVSGEDSTLPILGYSTQAAGQWDEELPCGLRYWLEAMHRQISQMRREGAEASEQAKRQRAAASVGSDVVLHETAAWSQDAPYNQQCPTVRGVQCMTGCGPTATAIVMRHHQWPERGKGATEAYRGAEFGLFVGRHSLEHDYDWSNMPLTDIAGGCTGAQAYAVSTLMYDVGCVLNADYSPAGTGIGYFDFLYGGLHDNLDYSPNTHMEFAETYDEDSWERLLHDALAASGPLVYMGISETEGHAFVLDGYTDNGYFHINWGWGGTDNGYFILPDIAYNASQAALLGFKPNDSEEAVESTLKIYPPGLTASTPDFASGVPFHIACDAVMNVSLDTFSGSLRFALRAVAGGVREWLSDEFSYDGLQPCYMLAYSEVPCRITGKISEGDRIRMFYKQADADEWKLLGPLMVETEECDWEIVVSEPAGIKATKTGAAQDDATYDMAGRRIARPTRGSVYIQGGRKIVAR